MKRLSAKTPHPSPLPTSGERGWRRRFFLKGKLKNPLDIFLRFFIYYKKLIHRIPSPRLRGEARVRGYFSLKNWNIFYFKNKIKKKSTRFLLFKEKDEAFINKGNLKTQILSRIRRFTRRVAIQLKAKFALANLMRSKRRDLINSVASFKSGSVISRWRRYFPTQSYHLSK